MKWLWGDKDGGPESKVWYYGLEFKRLGSIVLLLFKQGTRPVYHSHAFNSLSWVLSGGLREHHLGAGFDMHFPSFSPLKTYRTTYHMVEGLEESNWVFSLRGPWIDRWYETHPDINKEITLTHGRVEVP